jgi:hypothetical protein
MRRLWNGELDDEQAVIEGLLYASLPHENIADLEVQRLDNDPMRQRFRQSVRDDGDRWSRVRATWHFPGGQAATEAIIAGGISCKEEHCSCGRYGQGGYVAVSAAKANAYANSAGEGGPRCLFLMLALPEENVVKGERGIRPERTAVDLISHPTEYCFVDSDRLYAAYLVKYRWVPTGRRQKVTTVAPSVSHIVPKRSRKKVP